MSSGDDAFPVVDFPDTEDDASSRRSRRRTRREQRRSAMHRGTQLNIVSLIDVFAVLVFFLLSGASITAGRYQQLPVAMPATAQAQNPEPESEPLLLSVTLLEDSVVVADHSGELARLPRTVEQSDLHRSLSDMLAGIKAANPDESHATLRVASGIAYADIVNVMDIISRFPGEARAMFPDISLGDVLAGEVIR